ncbi:MAG: MFS transporter [Leptolyngbyaceae cyanobacterium SM1_3_5]|nr:MFS transporter [Leptolyngbyaceae cyanobacterium SM1_3_5]
MQDLSSTRLVGVAMSIDTVRARVLLLAACQALAMTGSIVLFTTAALVGQSIATNKALATLPLALLQIATMLTTIPASLLMQRIGRQLGFMVGVLIGLAGQVWRSRPSSRPASRCSASPRFCLAAPTALLASTALPPPKLPAKNFRSQAIALVVAGGVVAALLAPSIATQSKDALAATFAGSYVAIAVLQILSLGVLLLLKLPRPVQAERGYSGRSIGAIVQQPVFLVAILGSMLGYGVMVLVMTATPLAMVAQAHPFHEAAMVIQWHVLGMFTPSFFTGYLIARFGVLTIIGTGGLLSLLCLAINLLGSGLVNFSIALLLLGIGWNFLYIGSTTLLTEAYQPEERAKTQALHDFLMFALLHLQPCSQEPSFSNWAGLPSIGRVCRWLPSF